MSEEKASPARLDLTGPKATSEAVWGEEEYALLHSCISFSIVPFLSLFLCSLSHENYHLVTLVGSHWWYWYIFTEYISTDETWRTTGTHSSQPAKLMEARGRRLSS